MDMDIVQLFFAHEARLIISAIITLRQLERKSEERGIGQDVGPMMCWILSDSWDSPVLGRKEL